MGAVTAASTYRVVPNLDMKEITYVITTASSDDTFDVSDDFATIYSVYGCEVSTGTDQMNLSWTPTTSSIVIGNGDSISSKSVSVTVRGLA